MNRIHLRLAAAVSAVALTALATAPASAATIVSRSGANAIFLSVAGNGQGTGNVTATNDGTSETRTGDATPPLSVLKNQQVLNAGVLAQEATAKPTGSAACSGIAGNGGSVAQVGDSHCLSPGTPVSATLGSLDLSKLVVADPNSALAPLNQGVTPILTNLAPAIAAINSGLDQARSQLGDLGLVAHLGVVEGRCTAANGTATGAADVVDTDITLQAPGKTVTLLTLPVNPAPNTHLTTNLADVLDMVLNAVDADVTQSLDGSLSQLTQVTAALRDQVVANIRSQVEKNLAPLEQNVLDITLNQQVRPTADSIKVRALDLKLLPAAQAQLGAPLVNLQIGNAACGPADRVSAPQAAAPSTTPKLPHTVSAGLATAPGHQAPASHGMHPATYALLALAGLFIAGAGMSGIRRLGA